MDYAHEKRLHQGFFTIAEHYGWTRWAEQLLPGLHWIESTRRNSDREVWELTFEQIGSLQPSIIQLNCDRIQIGQPSDITGQDVEKNDVEKNDVEKTLRLLCPWRKGPFQFFGVDIDTEWRSDWKWQRVFPKISDLKGRKILDVGCGSGYHCLRMLGAGAQMVLGIDPSQLFWTQFRLMKLWLEQAIDKDYPYPPKYNVHFLPLPLERFPKHTQAFDTVFSMGVLYHRKSPFEHLEELRGCLRKGGELVLETLVIEGDENTVFVPPDRYASMNNVWCLPSVDALCKWMMKVGFTDVKLVDLNQTSMEEQRSTDWMTFQSLSDFLDPQDSLKTIEGHPAPLRATIVGTRI